MSRLRALLAALDARDLHFYGGLTLATLGGASLSLPRTLIVVGAVLAVVGLRGVR